MFWIVLTMYFLTMNFRVFKLILGSVVSNELLYVKDEYKPNLKKGNDIRGWNDEKK